MVYGVTAPAPIEVSAPGEHVGELKRGAWTNALALFASNFRGVFTFLVARLLGPSVLGIFSVAWAATDLLTKLAVFSLDDATTTFLARSEAAGNRPHSRNVFRIGVGLAFAQCVLIATLSIFVIRILGPKLHLEPQMATALSILFCAIPGVGLYRINTAASRGMKVMRHDVYSRGLTETIGTTAAFLIAFAVGLRTFAPEAAAIAGTAASGLVAFILARSLFCSLPPSPSVHWRTEARRLLAFAAPISAYDLINAFIVRSDVIMLGCFIGRAPGVTLPVVGIYGAAVEVAGGLRKMNQVFNPIFAPVVAGITVHGKQEGAADAFSRVAQWMLWILLPLVAGILLGGSTLLMIYGPAFPRGATWLSLIAVACATNAFASLAETVVMVQRPQLNLVNSCITCAVTLAANFWLISHFGALGAAFGIVIPYVVLGILRYAALRRVFGWRNPLAGTGKPFIVATLAFLPAVACKVAISGIKGQAIAVALFALLDFAGWRRFGRPSRRESLADSPVS